MALFTAAMTFDQNENGDPLEVEAELMRMLDICLREHNDNHRFTSAELVRARNAQGGGRRAYTENQYENEVVPKLLRLKYVVKQPDNSFILSEIGMAQAKLLRQAGTF